MTTKKLPVLILAGVLAAGCGSGDREEEVDRETVFDPLVDTLDQAEAVNDLTLEHKSRMDEALDEMEGDDDEPEGL